MAVRLRCGWRNIEWCNRIESEEREDYLMQETLLRRYSIMINGEETEPANVIERMRHSHLF